jgi:hypothetical protein
MDEHRHIAWLCYLIGVCLLWLHRLCTISRFWTHFLDRLRSAIINSTLNFELLCKAGCTR